MAVQSGVRDTQAHEVLVRVVVERRRTRRIRRVIQAGRKRSFPVARGSARHDTRSADSASCPPCEWSSTHLPGTTDNATSLRGAGGPRPTSRRPNRARDPEPGIRLPRLRGNSSIAYRAGR